MAIYKVQAPDGSIMKIEGPDGATDAQIAQAAAAGYQPKAKTEPGFNDRGGMGQNLAGSVLGGAGDIGATLLSPIDWAARKLNGGQPVNVGGYDIFGQDRRAGIEGALKTVGVDTDSGSYKVGKIGTQIAGTLGAGGALANGVTKAAPQLAAMAPNALNALRTSGMATGAKLAPDAAWMGAKGADMALRTAAGATVGGVSAGLINPDDAGMGTIVGGAAPGVFKLAGSLGQGVYNAVRANPSQAGKTLAKALGVDESQIPGIIAAANKAPESIVPGSKLTLSQALETQGANLPEVRTLEKVVAQSPGGKNLSMRYQDQSGARMNALVNQGAQRYQGAAAVEAQNTGNQLGAMLRTQADDDFAGVRKAWEGGDGVTGVHGRAAREGAMLQIPIDRMKAAVSERMGDGYTGGSAATSKTIKEA